MPTYTALAVYPIILLTIIILAFLVSHYREFTRTNSELRIQQTEHPDNDTIYTLTRNKLPTIFLYDIELWDGIDLMIGYPYEDIKSVLANNTTLIRQFKRLYLSPFSAPLTKDWTVELKRNSMLWDSIPNTQQATMETCYGGHYVATMSGLLCICLINPSHNNKIWLQQNKYTPDNDHSSTTLPKLRTAKYFIDATSTDATTKSQGAAMLYDNHGKIITGIPDLEYITLPLRPSHMLYIPYGWYYYIYCGLDDSYACYLDLYNRTWI